MSRKIIKRNKNKYLFHLSCDQKSKLVEYDQPYIHIINNKQTKKRQLIEYY